MRGSGRSGGGVGSVAASVPDGGVVGGPAAWTTAGNTGTGVGVGVGATGEFSSSSSQTIDSMHSDYIFKVVFDTYGRRMATCSADRCVRIWDLQDTGEWMLVSQWQAHRGAVTSLAFAHPEYGHLLATCGSDNDAIIWEEKTPSASSTTTTTSTQGGGGGGLSSRWISRASLTDARRTVTCLEFAPRHWGLKLAVGSADGCVRIYEAVDIMNLAQWPLAATLQSQTHISSLSWCTGRFEPLTLVAGGSHLVIYRYVESARAWRTIIQLPTTGEILDVAWAPNVGRRYHLIAATSDDGQLRVHKLSREISTTTTTNTTQAANNNQSNKTEDTTNSQQQQQAPTPQQQQQQHALVLESTQTLPVSGSAAAAGGGQCWQVQWNVTGTVLASSGDGGVVQMWKADAMDGEYVCVSHIQGGDPMYNNNNNHHHHPMETS